MPRPLAVLVMSSALLALVACDNGSTNTTVPGEPTTTTTSSTTTTTITQGGNGELPAPPCLSGPAPFQEDGNAGTVTSTQSDARVVTGIRWRIEGGCERLSIGFSTAEGAPAVSPPTVASSLIRDSAVLRINLGAEVTGSAIAEQLVDTELVDRVYVVRAPTGLFLDVHLAAPALARVTSEASPARAIVDLRPGGQPYRGRATRSDGVVVVEPVVGPVRYPFSVTGYVRTGAEAVEAVLRGTEERTATSGTVPSQDDAWGGFVVLFAEGPPGRVSIEVGGSVTVELSVS